MLGLDQHQELVLSCEQVAADLSGVVLLVLATQGLLDVLGHSGIGQDTLGRCRGGVVPLGHLRAVAVLLDELLLG